MNHEKILSPNKIIAPRDVTTSSDDPIDDTNGNYDAEGHSTRYGFGRLNAKKAATLAVPSRPGYVAIHTAVQDVAIKDMQTSQLAIAVGDTRPLKSVKIIVDIEHTYIGDLVVHLNTPNAMGVAPIMVHDKFGGGTNNIKRTFDTVNTPELSTLMGKNPLGEWMLEVIDTARADTGKIRKFTVELGF